MLLNTHITINIVVQVWGQEKSEIGRCKYAYQKQRIRIDSDSHILGYSGHRSMKIVTEVTHNVSLNSRIVAMGADQYWGQQMPGNGEGKYT